MQAGMIVNIKFRGAGIVCRLFPTDADVFIPEYGVRRIELDQVDPPLVIPELAKRVMLFRLYSFYLWRIGEWKHLRFVKYGRGMTGVVANDGSVWSAYNICELYYLIGG